MSGITYKHAKASKEDLEALDKAGRILTDAGFDCFAIVSGKILKAQIESDSLNIGTNLKMSVKFSACAAIAILSNALKHLDNPKDQLAYLVTICRETLDKVNPELAKEINEQVDSGADEEDDPEKMN
ncbi:hypothetical protein [uncultured Acidaminococcus sp.]|uniref:hypothetical protein n=1 Tax=uncultured Acidaminococcus sp. TaxID=352152 RepID=UPI002665D200|nr:hypothetical protein [uncultured Acidaminococcus sp.]